MTKVSFIACYIRSLDFPGQRLTIRGALLVFLDLSCLWEWETKLFHTNDADTHAVPQHSLHSLTFPCGSVSELPGGKKTTTLKKGKCGKTSSSLPTLSRTLSPKFSLLFKSLHWTFSWPDIFRRALTHTRLAFLWEGWSVPPWQPTGPEWAPAASALKSTVRGGKAL